MVIITMDRFLCVFFIEHRENWFQESETYKVTHSGANELKKTWKE